jgi:serine/threonine-protein kinase SRPK3
MGMVKRIAKQVLLGLDYIHRCCGVIHTSNPPIHHLLIPSRPQTRKRTNSHRRRTTLQAIIESEFELLISSLNSLSPIQSSAPRSNRPAPTKLTSVPPSKGRGGNQTQRSESFFITASFGGPFSGTSEGRPLAWAGAVRCWIDDFSIIQIQWLVPCRS